MIPFEERSRPSLDGPDDAGEERPAAFDERQRRLRTLLLDARDAAIRLRVGLGAENGPSAGRARWDDAGYGALRHRLRELVEETVPFGATVLVVSRGDDELLATETGGEARHFPCTRDGAYLGHHPADGSAAIELLEEQRKRGAEFLVFPTTSLWWLEHYGELTRHLEERYRRVAEDAEGGVVYDLRRRGSTPQPVVYAARGPRPEGAERPLAAVTIISRNYLAQARILARSFLAHEPDSRFYLLVVDGLPEGVEVGAQVTLVDPQELEVPDFYEMCFKYGIVEFNTAVKPYLLSLLFERYGEEEVAYFDPDIMIMRPLVELRQALTDGDIVLTPHIMRPLPLDGKRPSEQDIMISGAYNLGFIALRRSPATGEFLRWWEERLEDGCRIDVAQGLFTDQKWIDLVPSLFPSTVILRDPTYNVAFWNLHERSVSRDEGAFLVNDEPAAFFHISGFDPRKPQTLSKHQTRIEVAPGSTLEELLESYAALLLENGYEEACRWEYGYERFDNGVRVHPLLRQIYLNLGRDERARFGDPFAASVPGSFLDWATGPAEDGGLSPFLQTLYRLRYDLPLAFPDVRGRDRAAFLRWARRWGASEMGFDAALVRDVDASAGERPLDVRAAGGERRVADGAAAGRGGPPAMSYEAVLERIRNISRATLPAGSRVLVLSKGDYRLVDLGGVEGWHFPQTEDGTYGGYNPPDSEVAIAHLEALRAKGANYLLIPQPALWWLEYYEGFRRHLEDRYRLAVRDYDSCLIYSLREGPAEAELRSRRTARWWQRLLGRSPAAQGAPRQEAVR